MSEREKRDIRKTLQLSKQHRRTHLDITADILRASVSGIRKTRLMYRCNLNFLRLEKYLSLLLQKDLLRSVVAKKSFSENLFETTRKGKEFLKTYRSLEVLLTY